ncbi:MAG: arylsulfatase [Proteobacteria bacterium]|nr:arylsulfatase [Pseudomonadota bacterium]HQR03145.1 arylsulfatase [Rhodocyclaceae bacterium]
MTHRTILRYPCHGRWVRALLCTLGFAVQAWAAPTLPVPDLGKPQPVALTQDVPPPFPSMAASRAPAGAPNVVVVMLDDVGFGAAGTFGGPVPTPTLDALAHSGLRYNTFHTTGICTPTRASLLTGRNSHAVGVGNVMNTPAPYPGRNGFLLPSAATVAEVLRQNGYATALFGKWHLTPASEETPKGPFDRWPTRQGFERFYGFLDGESHQYEPVLIDGTTPVTRPDRPNYHLTEDLVDHTIAWMHQSKDLAPEKPFFVYLATGATHAPLHVPKEWIDRFHGQFDQGWDKEREETLARQKKLGVIPADTALTPRPAQLPAWSSLSPDRRRVASRLMETYAGFLAHTDAQIGRLVETLRDMHQLDNTMFIYIVGDNGASAEGGLFGTLNVMGNLQGVSESVEQDLARIDDIGSTRTYPHYPAGWAWAMDAPFQWTKQVASHLGGIRNPMVISWPDRIKDQGGLRSQFSHISDIMPTILEAAHIEAPAIVNGVAQQPIDGASLIYSFDDAKAPTHHPTQYFEVYGNRSIYHDGWMASAFHGRPPWALLGAKRRSFDEDNWELYNLDRDFSQAHDLAKSDPAKLRAMKDMFWAEAARNKVLPLLSESITDSGDTYGKRTHFTFHEGFQGVMENAMPRLAGRSYRISADVIMPASGGEGVIAAVGGDSGGWTLYVDHDGVPNYFYNLFGVEHLALKGNAPLPAGPVKVGFDFAYDGGGFGKGAKVTLMVGGKAVASGRLARTAPIFFSIDEPFDVGTDSGSPVGNYRPNYRFTGRFSEVALDLQ